MHVSATKRPSFLWAMAALVFCSVALRPVVGHAQVNLDAGSSAFSERGDTQSLGNHVIQARWSVTKSHLSNLTITDRLHATTLQIVSPFSLLLTDGTVVRMQDLHFIGTPSIHEVKVHSGAARFSDEIDGKELEISLKNRAGDVQVDWKLVLRDGSSYLRQVLTISAPSHDLAISQVRMLDLLLPAAKVVGTVTGSPIIANNWFFGLEHPLSVGQVDHDHVTADVNRVLPIPTGEAVTYSSVYGVAPEGQMRRAFLNYLERERAHPYRTFLHTNSWFDIAFNNNFDEAAALDEINSIGRELHVKRGVVLDSFLLDDGWDDYSTLWSFNAGFPNGFTAVRKTAEQYGAEPGVWLSPWGGYEQPKKLRVAAGSQAGFETMGDGFALSGPKYYARFRDACLTMIRKYGVNQFKFDGTGNVNSVIPGSQFDSDFDAMIHLIGTLREEKPNLFINLTTGTHASPFWLMYADSVWRGESDTNQEGDGTKRQQWITYRDATTYKNVVVKGPLFPLNSIMLHGIVYAGKNKMHLDADPSDDFSDEVHSYFGSGTQLQELYLTASLLSSDNWDVLAESAGWSRANADVLKDTHWIGGDPEKLEVYGWASWSPRKGILVLRNPSSHRQKIEIQLAAAFELPPNASKLYTAHSPWKADAGAASLSLNARKPHEFELAPFQVITLDMIPE